MKYFVIIIKHGLLTCLDLREPTIQDLRYLALKNNITNSEYLIYDSKSNLLDEGFIDKDGFVKISDLQEELNNAL